MSPLVFPARSRLLLRSRWWTGASRRTFCATRAARMASKGKWDIEVAMKEGPPLRLGFGKLAKMADGACVASMGSTSVLTTSVCPQPESESSSTAMPSFVPLTVDYRQKAAAAGRIPTNHLRREMGTSEKEILTARMVDRSVRPLFPKGFGLETQIVCNLLSVDASCVADPDVVAINAASASLAASDIPWNGPVGAVRVGYVDGRIVTNPSRKQMSKSELNLVVTGTAAGRMVMLEAEADNIDVGLFVDGVESGLQECAAIASAVASAVQQRGLGKRKLALVADIPEAVRNDLELLCRQKLESVNCDVGHDKLSRQRATFAIRDAAVASLRSAYPGTDPSVFYEAFTRLCRDIIARMAVEDGRRVDGRAADQVREITCETGLHPPLHGSALFQRGQTQVMCTVSLDSVESALKTDAVSAMVGHGSGGVREKNFFVHYEFPPYATNEIGRTTVGRRELGHGALAEKGLRAVIPKDFPFTIRLTSEVLESNGSSSMASVCGGTLALLDAGVPLSAPAAGVAVGLVQTGPDSRRGAVLLDILGLEDFLGEMDFKMAGTRTGVTALQADIKLADGLPLEVIREAADVGHKGVAKILDIMAEQGLAAPRTDKTNLPVNETLEVPAHKRARFMGPGGLNLKRLTSETGVQVTSSYEDVGVFRLFAPNAEAMAEAREMIGELLADDEAVPEYEFGAIIEVKVVEVAERGVFVEMHPGLPNVLIHVSQLSAAKVSHPSALDIGVGQSMQVKYFGRDPVTGATRLSRKALLVASQAAVRTLNKAARKQPQQPPQEGQSASSRRSQPPKHNSNFAPRS